MLRKKYSLIDFQPDANNTPSVDEEFLKSIIELVETNISDPLYSIQNLTEELSINHDQLYRKVKSLTGLSINHFIRTIRLKHAAQLLRSGTQQVSEILYQVGFNSPSYFTKCFKNEFGQLPTEYQEKFRQSSFLTS